MLMPRFQLMLRAMAFMMRRDGDAFAAAVR